MEKITFYFSFLLLFSTSLMAQTNRPQEPKPPFSYLSEEVVFENTTDGISLAGTLTMPKKGDQFPVVVLISGSGPQDRNSELLGHKSFLVMADYLTKKGIAVLRVDDRETGRSGGIYNETGIDGFKRDTEFAVAYLKGRKEIDTTKIGLIGHSLGGIIAPMIASESADISFIIMLAGPGLRGDQLMLLQKELIERKMGMPDAVVADGQKNIGGAYNIILNSGLMGDSLTSALKTYFIKTFGEALPESQVNAISQSFAMPWFSDLIKHNPKTSLSKVTCPVLALNGSNDLQVPAKENLEAIKTALANNKQVETMELPNLNHLFQASETGLPTEYATIEETFSPKVLKTMAKWIRKTVK